MSEAAQITAPMSFARLTSTSSVLPGSRDRHFGEDRILPVVRSAMMGRMTKGL